jgi:hypothetical protein
MLQTVHKLLQTVATRENLPIRCPDAFAPFPSYMREQIRKTMASNTPTRRKNPRSDLVHLRSLLSAQPATSTGQVVAAWEAIEAGLATGMKLREVWEAAKLDGLEIPYPQFRVYVSRLRRRSQRSSASAPVTNGLHELPAPPPRDPFNNLREQREKKEQSGFEYDPFSINKNLIG